MTSRREYDRRYYERHRAEVLERNREWRRANPDRMREYQRARYETNPDEQRESVRRYRQRNPEKSEAHHAVRNALSNGLLTRQPCEVCGAEKVEAHHGDYSKPLDVRWLCRKCHKEAHRES